MISKIFIDANTFLIDSFSLAQKIYHSGFRPDIFIGVWRGGTPAGIAVHEFFVFKGIKPRYHTCIKAESYHGIEQRGEVFIEGIEPVIEKVTTGDNILVVDDIYDTGKSIEAIKKAFKERIHFTVQIKIATVYFKPEKNLTDCIPDYYIKDINTWVVFPHELQGLSEKELKEKGENIFRIVGSV